MILMLSLTTLLMGCATQNKSVGLGAAVGGGTGALIGGIADPGKNGELRTRNVIIGAGLGAMTGMIAGSILHSESEKSKREEFLKGQKAGEVPVSGAMPNLSSPKVETHWVEGRVQGNRYIEGHFEYVIIEPVRWDVK
jgi:hypothetical protein